MDKHWERKLNNQYTLYRDHRHFRIIDEHNNGISQRFDSAFDAHQAYAAGEINFDNH